jgi:GrpB-like predicted nucleotidyltransferase (UPF0157 family)
LLLKALILKRPFAASAEMHPSITQTGTAWSNAAEDRIELADSDPSWPQQYESEAAALLSALGPITEFRLEHFGSTAIAKLRAKPIIDILLIHSAPEVWPQFVEPLSSLGYIYWAQNPRTDRMFFVKGMPPFGTRRTHHLHVRVPSDAQKELSFRDLLRDQPALAREYERIKERLAIRYPADRDAYTDGKSAFITEALQRVR